MTLEFFTSTQMPLLHLLLHLLFYSLLAAFAGWLPLLPQCKFLFFRTNLIACRSSNWFSMLFAITISQFYNFTAHKNVVIFFFDWSRYVVGFGSLDPLSTSDSLQSTIRTKKLAPNVKKRKFISPTRSRGSSAAQPSERYTPKRRTAAATSSKQRWRCWGCAQWVVDVKYYWKFLDIILYINITNQIIIILQVKLSIDSIFSTQSKFIFM